MFVYNTIILIIFGTRHSFPMLSFHFKVTFMVKRLFKTLELSQLNVLLLFGRTFADAPP